MTRAVAKLDTQRKKRVGEYTQEKEEERGKHLSYF